jgi:hypothetical protein
MGLTLSVSKSLNPLGHQMLEMISSTRIRDAIPVVDQDNVDDATYYAELTDMVDIGFWVYELVNKHQDVNEQVQSDDEPLDPNKDTTATPVVDLSGDSDIQELNYPAESESMNQTNQEDEEEVEEMEDTHDSYAPNPVS